VAGAGDAPAAAVAAGLEPDGRNALASLGTGGQIYVRSSRAIVEVDGRLHTLCHPAPAAWSLMAAILSAGGALQWLVDALLGRGRSPASLLRDAGTVAAGADGLLFTPWLRGERSVHLDPHVRGAFVGLGLHHGRGHLARAVLEGVAFALRAGLETMAGMGVQPVELVVAGGGARSALWRRVLCDVLGVPVSRLPGDDASALGAARLAADGASFDSERWRIPLRDHIEPDADKRDQYESAYGGYSRLYGVLRHL
jgi:xylulokinase